MQSAQIKLDGNIRLRLAGPQDQPFLSSLFHESRHFIYQFADAEYDYKRMVVEQQETIRANGYGDAFPEAMDFIIERLDTRVGRVLIDFSRDVVHVVDILLLAAVQGLGLGESVMRGVQATACAAGAPVTLCVAQNNPVAYRLYTKLGFVLQQRDNLVDRLIWHPTAAQTVVS